MRKHLILHLSLILLVALSVGCSRRPSDEQIQKDIQTKAAADPATKDSAVAVTAKEGKVTLTGKVPNEAAGKELEKIAKEEPGVSDVDDQTSIDTNAASAPEAPVSQAAAQAPEPPPPPQPVVVPAGTVLTVRVGQALGSKASQTGDSFTATVADPVAVKGKVVIPAGSTASGKVIEAQAKGKIKGEARLKLALTSITIKGNPYTIQTNMSSTTEKGKGKRTAVATGGGAAGGALIGGIAGGGKGAAIGAGVGAAAGFLGGTFTGNKQIEIPAESALSFQLTQPLTVKP
jgi:BON domain